jgi:hypothetical protein
VSTAAPVVFGLPRSGALLKTTSKPFAWYSALNTPLGAVASWPDISGNERHATQNTGTKQPTNTAGQLNGKPALYFDNGDTLVLPSSFYALAAGAFTLFAVADRTSESGASDVIFSLSEAGATRTYLRFESVSGQVNFTSNTTGGSAVTRTGLTNTNYQIFRALRNGTSLQIQANNGAVGAGAFGADETGIDAAHIGSMADSANYLDGYIAEIIVFNYALSAQEIIDVNTYLSAKWGIAIS